MRKKIYLGVIVLVMILIAGFMFLLQFAPPSGSLPTYADIAYAEADPESSDGHLLDLYLPSSDQLAPLIIWSGGSGWLSDNGKRFAGWLAPELNKAGFALAGVSIRSSSQVSFPGQLHDIKSAIRWLRINSEDYGIDPNRIAVMGDSSGGWVAAMAGVTGDAPEMEGFVGVTGVSSAVQAVVAFYPPTRFTEMDKNSVEPCTSGAGMLGMLLGKVICHDDPGSPESRLLDCPIQSCLESVNLADPTRYITEQDPPIMILHGEADRLVPHAQGELLYSMLSDACHDTIFVSLPTAGHGPAWDFLGDDTVREGATIRSTSRSDCFPTEPTIYSPDMDTVIDFFKQNLVNI